MKPMTKEQFNNLFPGHPNRFTSDPIILENRAKFAQLFKLEMNGPLFSTWGNQPPLEIHDHTEVYEIIGKNRGLHIVSPYPDPQRWDVDEIAYQEGYVKTNPLYRQDANTYYKIFDIPADLKTHRGTRQKLII